MIKGKSWIWICLQFAGITTFVNGVLPPPLLLRYYFPFRSYYHNFGFFLVFGWKENLLHKNVSLSHCSLKERAHFDRENRRTFQRRQKWYFLVSQEVKRKIYLQLFDQPIIPYLGILWAKNNQWRLILYKEDIFIG